MYHVAGHMRRVVDPWLSLEAHCLPEYGNIHPGGSGVYFNLLPVLCAGFTNPHPFLRPTYAHLRRLTHGLICSTLPISTAH